MRNVVRTPISLRDVHYGSDTSRFVMNVQMVDHVCDQSERLSGTETIAGPS